MVAGKKEKEKETGTGEFFSSWLYKEQQCDLLVLFWPDPWIEQA
jgi:tRNA G46 methylase TrmB